MYIRVSAGTAGVLGLNTVKNDTPPTTAYLIVHHRGKYSANCSFCPQSKSASGIDAQLSRITWPRYPLTKITSKLEKAVESHKLFRAYIQTLNYPMLLAYFDEVYGKGKVATHIIVGLGETEQELLQAVQDIEDLGVIPCLFAFTPIKGTKEEARPQTLILVYRKMQLKKSPSFSLSPEGELKSFNLTKNEYEEILPDGSAFQTRGCPQCGRPYYDSHPGGTIYNYAGPLTKEQKAETEQLFYSVM